MKNYNHSVGVDLDTMDVLRRIKAELNQDGAKRSFADIIRMLVLNRKGGVITLRLHQSIRSPPPRLERKTLSVKCVYLASFILGVRRFLKTVEKKKGSTVLNVTFE
jgi:hypothetical protein